MTPRRWNLALIHPRRLLDRMTPRRWIIALSITAALVLYAAVATQRYQLTTARVGSHSMIYKLDRWTGKTWMAFPGDSFWFEMRD
jgi:mannose/cellobiose epimerase-like protein (N-acyl-D-glucosamine 2-epimerase family)